MELIIDSSNNIEVTLQEFIDDLVAAGNEQGTILFSESVVLSSNIKEFLFPAFVTLQFKNGNKLLIGDRQVRIFGQIESKLNQIIQTPLDHNITIHNEIIFPEWFGLCTYQAFDPNPEATTQLLYNDDIPIQKAINASVNGSIIKFLGAIYRINNTVNINTHTIKLVGKSCAYNSRPNNSSNRISLVNPNLNVVFNIQDFGIKFEGLNFGVQGNIPSLKGADGIATALNYQNARHFKDLDAEITKCNFRGFAIAIYGEGTNLKIIDNGFTACKVGVSINRVQENVEGQSESFNKRNKSNTRGHVISRNRFHSCGGYSKNENLIDSACIKIIITPGIQFPVDEQGDPITDNTVSYHIRGYMNEITNNHADDCKTFFEGSVDRTKIDGNSILTSGGTAIKGFWGYHGSISNNIIDGSWTANPKENFQGTAESNLDGFPSGHGIHIRSAHHIKIHDNSISNKRFHGIYIDNSFGSSIQLNKISNYNRHVLVRSNGNYIVNNPEGATQKENSLYNGIHIRKPKKGEVGLNIENAVSNNHISIPLTTLSVALGGIYTAGYAIYAGAGDPLGFISNNFIIPKRMRTPFIKIE